MADHRHSGFTLIELSIVLVIIGLIAGGVLVGRDLIKTATLRKIISDIEKYQTATQAFRSKYNALPGDMVNASQFWQLDTNCPTAANPQIVCGQPLTLTCNGNGDGMVAGDSSSLGQAEMFRFWQHLSLASLITGNYSGTSCNSFYPLFAIGGNVPLLAINNGSGIMVHFNGAGFPSIVTTPPSATGYHLFTLGSQYSPIIPFSQAALSPHDALYIDSKIDDGSPYGGQVTSRDFYPGSCVAGTNQYKNSDGLGTQWYMDGCIMQFIAQF